ncbi:MAG: BatD family protein, partial [Puniceicoccales bacterium]|nr:BatD family protein [Puniceicoccales bacterium]
MNRQFWIRFLCFGPWALGISSAADVQLRAFFQPSRIRLGQSAQYVVEASGNISPFSYQPPSVDGLRFGQSQNMQSLRSINGHQSVQLSKTFRVQARRTGSFTIPVQTLSLQGKDYELPSATLQVIEGEEELEEDEEEENLRKGILGSRETASNDPVVQLSTTLAPEEPFYVGQLIPIRVELSSSVSCELLQPEPKINGPFSEGQKTASRRGTDKIDWDTTVSPIKAGELPLQYSLAISVSVLKGYGWFGPVYDQQKKEILSQELSLQVQNLPLPAPSSFGGAIGNFSLGRTQISDTQTLLEEPLTLRIEVEGEGNWERLAPPEFLYEEEDWKIYPPKGDFRPSDALQYRGKKSFDCVLMPLKTGQLALPTLEMSYFDPRKREYQTLRHEFPEKILVSRNRQISPQASAPKGSASAKPHGEKSDEDKAQENTPEALESPFFYLQDTAHFSSLSPFYRRRGFWLWQFLPLALYLTWLGSRYARQRAKALEQRDPRRHRRSLRHLFGQAQRALEKGEAELASKAL